MFNQRSIVISFLLLASVMSCSLSSKRTIDDKPKIEDKNLLFNNSKDELYRHSRHFVPPEVLSKIELGINENDLYQIIGTYNFTERFTYNRVLPKRIKYLKYIPVSKMIIFVGGNTKVTPHANGILYETSERMTVTFFFYQERLVYQMVDHTNYDKESIYYPDTSEEIRNAKPYEARSLDTTNGISGTNYVHDSKYYGYVNGYLAEKFTEDGKRYFTPNFKVSKFSPKEMVSWYCDLYAYWEFPDFESDLQKSGYYKLKAKLDKDFENKTGYWEEKLSK